LGLLLILLSLDEVNKLLNLLLSSVLGSESSLEVLSTLLLDLSGTTLVHLNVSLLIWSMTGHLADDLVDQLYSLVTSSGSVGWPVLWVLLELGHNESSVKTNRETLKCWALCLLWHIS
jgi:hypothetical protein